MAQKIFIAMPKNGMNREEVQIKLRNIFYLAEKYLGEKGMLFFCDVEDEHKERPIKNVFTALEQLIEADRIVFAEGYENFRSYRLEYFCASEYGKKILLLHGNEIQEVY